MTDNSKFKDKWGQEVLTGGFTQIPNDLMRNFGTLQLKPSEIIVYLEILSVGKGYASANSIARWSGLSVGTIRRAYRTLEKKTLLNRTFGDHEANSFDTRPTIYKVRDFAIKRQYTNANLNRRVYKNAPQPITNSHTNKESEEQIVIETASYIKARETANKIKESSRQRYNGSASS